MTGYESKRAAARDKLVQDAFNDWWNSDYDDRTNPYEKDSFAYWAWAGWQAALAQSAQEPVVFNTLTSLRHKKTVGPIESAMRNIASTQPAQVYQDHDDALTIAYQSGYYDGKKVAQPAQEPMAWITPDGEGFRIRFSPPTNDVPLGWQALYTTPPQRPWVGLTEEDLKPLCAKWRIVYGGWTEDFARDIEAELKEKNT